MTADRKARILETQRERLRECLVSCVECGVLCRFAKLQSREDAVLLDLHREDVDDVIAPVVGIDAVWRQGIGVGTWEHRCPPCRSRLTEVEVRELQTTGGVS